MKNHPFSLRSVKKNMLVYSRRPDQHRVQGVGQEHLLRSVRAARLRALRADGGPLLNDLVRARAGLRRATVSWRRGVRPLHTTATTCRPPIDRRLV